MNKDIKCNVCGQDSSEDSLFCGYCGNKFTNNTMQVKEDKPQKIEDEELESKDEELESKDEAIQSKNEAIDDQNKIKASSQITNNSHNIEKIKDIKNKYKGKWFFIILIIVLVGAGSGAGLYFYIQQNTTSAKAYEEGYTLNDFYTMSYGPLGDSEYGENLYLQTTKGEPQLLAQKVKNYQFKVAPKTGRIAYIDDKDNLYITKPGEDDIKVSKDVKSTYMLKFLKSEEYLFFAAESESSGGFYIYDIANDVKEKLCDGSYYSYFIDEDSNTFFYIDVDNNFYKVSNFIDKEKIDKNVSFFKVLGKDTYIYRSSKGDKSRYILSSKKGEEVLEEDLDFNQVNLYEAVSSEDGKLSLFTVNNDDTYTGEGMGDLHIKLQGQDPIEIDEEVTQYAYAEAAHTIYYLNDDNMFYSIVLPKLTHKVLEDSNIFKEKLEACEKNKLYSNAESFKISPDGKNAIVSNEDGKITLLRNGDQLKITDHYLSYYLFNEYVAYITEENELFVQEGIATKTISAITEEPRLLAEQLVGQLYTTEYGKYMAYLVPDDKNETNSLVRYSKDREVQIMVENTDAYDVVQLGNLAEYKSLKYNEIVGKYICKDYNFALELDNKNNLTVYSIGEQKGTTTIKSSKVNRTQINITPVDEIEFNVNVTPTYPEDTIVVVDESTRFIKVTDTEYQISNLYTQYDLKRVTDAEFQEELNRQVEEEKERKAAEEEARRKEEEERLRRQEEKRQYGVILENKARGYFTYGVYLPSRTKLYQEHDYSAYSRYTTTNNSNWNITDYYIDYDHSIIWVQVKHKPNNGYSYEYAWVPIS